MESSARKPVTRGEVMKLVASLALASVVFKGCVGTSSSGCSAAEARLDKASESTVRWAQQNPTITSSNFSEATSVANNQVQAEAERDRACR
jgi:hypothetical protein